MRLVPSLLLILLLLARSLAVPHGHAPEDGQPEPVEHRQRSHVHLAAATGHGHAHKPQASEHVHAHDAPESDSPAQRPGAELPAHDDDVVCLGCETFATLAPPIRLTELTVTVWFTPQSGADQELLLSRLIIARAAGRPLDDRSGPFRFLPHLLRI